MNTKERKQRVPLGLCQENFILHEPLQQCKKSAPKSQRKNSSSSTFNRMSFYSKQKSQIPSVKQAKLRQKQIIKFHNRNFFQRQKRLEEIFKQNCRIYIQLNKQKSHYIKNFNTFQEKKINRSHNASCSQYNSTKFIGNQRTQKISENGDFLFSKFQRRYSMAIPRPKKQLQLQDNKKTLEKIKLQDDDNEFEFKRFEKNKTEMIPRKNLKPNLQNARQLYSLISHKSCKNSQSSETKNPIYMRLKRRPNSGFRA